MTASTRMDKLFSALTAKERGLLVLQAWKEGRDEDRQVRSAMPTGQYSEFNRYIALMNGVNQHLGPFILLLKALTAQLELTRGWLVTIELWGMNALELASYIFTRTKEPICRSDYEKLPAPRIPYWGLDYDVFPDRQRRKVERLLTERQAVRKALASAPATPLPALLKVEITNPSWGDDTAALLRKSLEERIPEYWSQLRASELVIAEVAREFGGEDPALPELRARLDSVREELLDLHSVTSPGSALPEPGEDTLGHILKLVQRDLKDDSKELTVTPSTATTDGASL